METEFCSVSLDIIGKAVFNYEFGSVTKESPVVKAVYRALQEAEHRSVFLCNSAYHVATMIAARLDRRRSFRTGTFPSPINTWRTCETSRRI